MHGAEPAVGSIYCAVFTKSCPPTPPPPNLIQIHAIILLNFPSYLKKKKYTVPVTAAPQAVVGVFAPFSNI